MTTNDLPHVLLLWPYGIEGAESIPMCMSFLEPQLRRVANVSVLDCSLWRLHPEEAAFRVNVLGARPDLIGISSWSQNWRWVQRTIRVLRQILPGVPIVLGGPHVTATNDVGLADYALTGEAEYSFPALIQALASDAPDAEIDAIPGLRRADLLLPPAPPALVQDLDALGLPNFDAMLLPLYQRAGYRYRNGERKQAPLLATRGCPYECAFCEAPMLSGRKIRKHSTDYLRELLLHLRTAFDVTHVNIVDDNFSFYPAYAIAFCEMVLATPQLADMTFATPNGLRVERSNAEMFKAMKAAGWARVIFAPESGSQRMVDVMAKHLDLGVIPGRVAMARAAGLEVEAFFILNYPGETDADVDETERFIRATDFDEISLHIFKPLPHTPIWRELVDSGRLAPEYVVGRYDEVDWLANGRTKADIERHIAKYLGVSRALGRVA